MRNQTIVVDINKEICKILKYKQYDNNNLLQIIVEENYKKVNLEGYFGFALFQLPSGMIIEKDCEIQENVISITIDNNILSEDGTVALDLTLSDGEKTFTLFRIILTIEKTIDRDEAIIIEAGWDIVAEITKFRTEEVQRQADEAQRLVKEEQRLKEEVDRQDEEIKRKANETQRLINEEQRISKENKRLIDEELRTINENKRLEKEEQRLNDEQKRISAEEIRLRKEIERLQSETDRNNSEMLRVERELERIERERQRLIDEEIRKSNENIRISNEKKREDFFNGLDINLGNVELLEQLANTVSEVQNDMMEVQNDMMEGVFLSSEVANDYKFVVNAEGMMSSLLTLNDIEGLSSVETNDRSQKRLVSTNIGTICTIDINGKNYAEDMVCLEAPYNSEYVIDGTNITVRRNTPYTDNITSFAFASISIPTLEDGKKYCIFCDDVEISNGGASAIEIHSEHDTFVFGDSWNSLSLDTSRFNNIIIYDSKSFIMRLHCTIGSHVGEVTYKNLQIYEVKEMIVPDIQLNSLPNGVKDEIKNGVLIKRTGIVNLADLTWACNSDQSTFAMYYSKDVPNIKCSSSFDAIDNNILCNMFKNSSTSIVDDPNNYSENIINSHWSMPELKIKISKNDCPSGDLNAWLANNNVHAVYELATPEYIPINLTIKSDKGDAVVINTTKKMDLTYDIQLNTRAQIDALQTNINHHHHAHSMLVVALKEAINKIEQLEERINELENKE